MSSRQNWAIRFYLQVTENFVSFSMTDSSPYICNFSVWSNFRLLRNFQWITFPTQSWPFLDTFCIRLLHSLWMWLTVSPQSPHCLHELFSCFSRVFHTSVFRWYFVKVWMTATLFVFPGLFWLFKTDFNNAVV